jgi:fucose 4-O-acetylase-like acetyltransferase
VQDQRLSVRHTGPATTGAGERLAYLDNLKTLLIAGIIAAHAVQGYATFGSWTYQDVQEVTLSPAVELVSLILVMSLGALFLMALFFLISGLLTQDSLTRKGPSRFASDRLLRLGIPFAVYTLLIWPLLEYSLLEPFLHRGFWRSVSNTDPLLDNGPMWFVGVLLLFSLALAAWRKWFPRPAPQHGPLRGRSLILLAVAVGICTFAVRIVFPADSNQPLNVKLWGWPEYVAMFSLGVAASSRGWLRPVAAHLARRCGITAIVAIACTAAFVVSAQSFGLTEDDYFGGWGLPALLAAMTEGVVAVSAPIWVLAFAQRHLNGSGRLRRAMARSSYAAFMLQGPVLVALALLLRPIDLSGDVKALLVATLGIVGSFAAAWPIVTKTSLRRIL